MRKKGRRIDDETTSPLLEGLGITLGETRSTSGPKYDEDGNPLPIRLGFRNDPLRLRFDSPPLPDVHVARKKEGE
ncbi:hypothetical protein KKB40_04950 [Patescibacteria group bacterium]|nr:hypothetical protein [Patescibacteria group bacterium]